MNKFGKNLALWVIIGLLLIALFNLFQGGPSRSTVDSITYSEFVASVEKSDISDVTIQGSNITGHDKDGRAFSTYAPDDPGLVQRLHSKGVRISAAPTACQRLTKPEASRAAPEPSTSQTTRNEAFFTRHAPSCKSRRARGGFVSRIGQATRRRRGDSVVPRPTRVGPKLPASEAYTTSSAAAKAEPTAVAATTSPRRRRARPCCQAWICAARELTESWRAHASRDTALCAITPRRPASRHANAKRLVRR